MTEHPLMRLSDSLRSDGGYIMEFWPKRPFRGGMLRAWMPTRGSADRLVAAAAQLGLSPKEPMGHLEEVGSREYEGFQVVIGFPAQLAITAPSLAALVSGLTEAPRLQIEE
jgi:hypothetical protein